MQELEGATVVVGGGGGHLGGALAHEVGRRGARVVIADVTNGEAAVDGLRAAGIEADFVEVEISDYAQVAELAHRVRTDFGGANVVTNCAVFAGGGYGFLEDADPDSARRAFEVNIIGYFNFLHAFAKDLKATAEAGKLAHVLTIGSEHTFGPPPHVIPLSMYTITKSAVLAFTSVLRRDFEGTGVGITMLAPGWIYTEGVKRLMEDSPELDAAVRPYAQYPEFIARAGIEGMLRNDFIVYPNPRAAQFAIDNFEEVVAELRRSEQIAAETPGPVWVQEEAPTA